MSWLVRQLDASRPVERDHWESDRAFRRRRLVVLATLVAGAALLWFSLSVEPGSRLFYPASLVLAATWTAGAFLSGPLHGGWMQVGSELRRPVLQPIGVGLVAVGVFAAGALVVGQVPFLESSVNDVLAHADQGFLPLIALVTVVNGVAEELFFRGALYAAVGVRHPVLVTTVVYTLTTVATGNVMLVFAAVVLGVVVGLQRRVSGGVLAPVLTHVTWSTGMLLVLPPIMGALV
ncbi:MAG: type II CAAX prenyl endopeptidase Rce1 family protein [Actinomycetes bacterium]